MATTKSDTQVFTATTVLQSQKVAEGEWKISEIKSDPVPEQDLHSGNRKDLQFDLAFGIGIGGYYDFDDKEISVSATFGGSSIGSRYTAGLETGVKLGIDLWVASGEVKIFKDGNQLKVGYSLGTYWTGNKTDSFAVCDL